MLDFTHHLSVLKKITIKEKKFGKVDLPMLSLFAYHICYDNNKATDASKSFLITIKNI